MRVARVAKTGVAVVLTLGGTTVAADRRSVQAWVERLWDAPVPEGQWRYYHGLLHLFGLLEADGRFRAFPPAPAT